MKESVAIIEYLQSLENIENQAGMKRFAIGNNNTLGVSMPVLRTLAKEYKKIQQEMRLPWSFGKAIYTKP